MDRCSVSEWITYGHMPNPPFCELDGSDSHKSGTSERNPNPPISGTKGDDGKIVDIHRHPWYLVSNPPTAGHYIVYQEYQYLCQRCDSGWQTAATYLIWNEIYDADPGEETDLKFSVEKAGPGEPILPSVEDVPGF